jgi:hypothetical protein
MINEDRSLLVGIVLFMLKSNAPPFSQNNMISL